MSNLSKIVKILRANGVSFAPDFARIESLGYASDDNEKLSKEIVLDVEELVKYALNNGGFNTKSVMGLFGGYDLSSTVKELTDLAVKQSGKKAQSKIQKYKRERLEILKDVKTLKESEWNMNVKEVTLKYIDTTVQGAEIAAQNFASNQTADANRKEGVKVLKQIKTLIEGVWDGSSKTACDLASKIINDCILPFRKEISAYTCFTSTVNKLKEAKTLAEEMSELAVAVKKKDLATKEYMEKTGVEYYLDDLDRIIESVPNLEALNSWEIDLKNYAQETLRLTDTTKEKELKEGKEAELKENKTQAEKVVRDLQNGRISRADAIEKLSDLKEDKAVLEEDVADLDSQIDELKELARTRGKIERYMSRILKKIDRVKSDPAWLTTAVKEINFVDVKRMLLGRTSAEEIDAVVVEVERTLDLIVAQNEQIRQGVDKLQDVNNVGKITSKVNKKVSQKEEEAELNALLAGFGFDKQENATENEAEDARLNNLISDVDDIN